VTRVAIKVFAALGLLGLLSVGCGTVKEGGGGAAADAAVDEPDSALPEPVTVLVRSNGLPLAGAFVFSHDTSGAQVGEALTDDNGVVVLTDVPAGGAVTAYLSENRVLDSVLGVQPGDVLNFDEINQRTGPQVGTLLTMSVRTPNEDSQHQVHYPCRLSAVQAGANEVVDAEVTELCSNVADIPIVNYSIAAGAPVRQSGSFVDQVDFKNLSGEVTMPATSELGVVGATMPSVTEAQAGVGEIEFHALYRDFAVETPPTLSYSPDGTEVTRSASFVDGLYEGFRVSGKLLNNQGEQAKVLHVAHNIGPTLGTPDTPAPADLTAATPFIDSVSVDSEDPLTVSFAVSSTDCGNGEVDARFAFVGQLFNDEQYFWRVIGPGGSGGLVYPRLTPFTQSQLWPEGDLSYAMAGFFSNSSWTYDDVRNAPSVSQFSTQPGTFEAQPTLGAPEGEKSCGAAMGQLQ
jgi:hypothetical protein